MFERELNRATDIAVELVNTTAVHLGRVVGFVSAALGRTARELADMVWDYRDLAGDLRPSGPRSHRAPDAVVLDLRRRLS
ncbi:hypothetical protein [Mycobacterium sp. 852002-51057_SCH5723018]|uniref:hypothetical protein n=1 Tax=Mycobacterium sp. 852002-51057_SCH5723018 TaxID=1834094 RepID=UPI0007FCC7C4|nr:hypothetical protein [Mycobacterium sp. 852002-51057_SCH5723018]OBG19258.1 hypothetical protein A5764_16535 [Mycobacterium sp. 852002-51057_SCH5723018]